jgi:hypothetical protein
MLLLRIIGALDDARVPYAVVGGYAVALHGAVRGTVDVDLVLEMTERSFVRAERALNTLGLQSRLPVSAGEVFRFRREYVRNRRMTAWSFVNPSRPSDLVDVILTHDLSTMRIKRVKVQGKTVKIASIEDLIKMKEKTGRQQDLEDIKALRKLK